MANSIYLPLIPWQLKFYSHLSNSKSIIYSFIFALFCKLLVGQNIQEGFHSDIDGISVSCGFQHTCAIEYRPGIEFGGVLNCWGTKLDYHFDEFDTFPEGNYIQVSAGNLNSCAIRIDQTIQCWGQSKFAPPGEFIQVSVAQFHACGLRKDQTVVCWGNNEHGEGRPPNEKFVQISTAKHWSCGLQTSGYATCWGYSLYSPKAKPPPDILFRQIAISDDHGCGIRFDDGGIVCWGANRLGQSVTVLPTDQMPQGRLDADTGPFRQVSLGMETTCAIGGNGQIGCWGHNINFDPGKYPKGTQYDQLSVGRYHFCAVTMDSELHCWGNIDGQITVPDGLTIA